MAGVVSRDLEWKGKIGYVEARFGGHGMSRFGTVGLGSER